MTKLENTPGWGWNLTNEEIMTEKHLGRISSVGICFDDVDNFLVSLSFSGPWGQIGLPAAALHRLHDEEDLVYKEWDGAARTFGEALCDLMRKAKASNFMQLKNKPVEIEVDGNRLVSWRILTEVLP